MYRAGGRVHRDTATIIRCMRRDVLWINICHQHLVRTTTTTTTATTATTATATTAATATANTKTQEQAAHSKQHTANCTQQRTAISKQANEHSVAVLGHKLPLTRVHVSNTAERFNFFSFW